MVNNAFAINTTVLITAKRSSILKAISPISPSKHSAGTMYSWGIYIMSQMFHKCSTVVLIANALLTN